MSNPIRWVPPSAKRQVEIEGHIFEFSVPSPDKTQWEAYWENLEGEDRFFPYWLETWNSAFVLYFFLESEHFKILEHEVIEVAGGCGVLSQLIADQIKQPYLFSDLVPEAVIFAKRQLQQHSIVKQGLWKGIALDVSQSAVQQKWPVIIASDCLYHPELAELFCNFFAKHLSEKGRVILADPNRHGVDAYKSLQKYWPHQITLHEVEHIIDGHPRLYQIFEMSF